MSKPRVFRERRTSSTWAAFVIDDSAESTVDVLGYSNCAAYYYRVGNTKGQWVCCDGFDKPEYQELLKDI